MKQITVEMLGKLVARIKKEYYPDSSWGSTSNAAKKDPQKKAVPKNTRNIGGKKRVSSDPKSPYQKRMS